MSDAVFLEGVRYALEQIGKCDLTLKREQESAIRHVYGGNDVFVWLPTGFGKSIVYECLPFLYDHKLGHLEGFSVVLVLLLIQLKLLEIFRKVNENLRACANGRYQAVFPSPARPGPRLTA